MKIKAIKDVKIAVSPMSSFIIHKGQELNADVGAKMTTIYLTGRIKKAVPTAKMRVFFREVRSES